MAEAGSIRLILQAGTRAANTTLISATSSPPATSPASKSRRRKEKRHLQQEDDGFAEPKGNRQTQGNPAGRARQGQHRRFS